MCHVCPLGGLLLCHVNTWTDMWWCLKLPYDGTSTLLPVKTVQRTVSDLARYLQGIRPSLHLVTYQTWTDKVLAVHSASFVDELIRKSHKLFKNLIHQQNPTHQSKQWKCWCFGMCPSGGVPVQIRGGEPNWLKGKESAFEDAMLTQQSKCPMSFFQLKGL